MHLFLLAAIFVHSDRPEFSFAPVSEVPLAVLTVFHTYRAWRFPSAKRWAITLGIATVTAWVSAPSGAHRSVYAWATSVHVGWLGVLVIGVAYRDRLAAYLRLTGLALTCGLVAIAIASACIGHWSGTDALLYIVVLQLVLLMMWQWNEVKLFDRVAIGLSVGWLVAFADVPSHLLIDWLGARSSLFHVAATLCFLAGLVISFSKAGWLAGLNRQWRELCFEVSSELSVTSAVDVQAAGRHWPS